MSVMRAKNLIREALDEATKLDCDTSRIRELLKEALRELNASEPQQTKLVVFDEEQSSLI